MSDVIDSQKLRALREARGWDQHTLAQQAKVDPSVVSRLERGLQTDLHASILVALARAMDIAVDTLLARPHQPAPELAAELTSAFTALSPLSPPQQRQVAAIIRAYLSTLPE